MFQECKNNNEELKSLINECKVKRRFNSISFISPDENDNDS